MESIGQVFRRTPWIGIVLYVMVGGVWIGVGDTLLAHWARSSEELATMHTIKGVLAVLTTALVGAWLLWRRQLAERAQQTTARQTEHVMRYAPAGIARIEAGTGRVIWANDRLCALTGLSREELSSSDFREVVKVNDRTWVNHQRDRLLAGEIDHYQGERWCERPGLLEKVPVMCTVTRVPQPQGQTPHLVCVVQDIREIYAARSALERSETRLRLALEGSGSGIWEWYLHSRKGNASAGMQRMLRYDGHNFAADFSVHARVHPEDVRRVITQAKLAILTGEPFNESLRVLCFDNVYRWFQAKGQRHTGLQGHPERFSGILTDLTNSRAAEERQRLAATVVDNTMEGVVVTDAQSNILSVNAAFTRLLGYDEKELLGKTPREFKSGRHDAAFYARMWDTMRRTGHWQGEIWNRRKNGEVFPEHMSLSAVYDNQGKVTHYVCIFWDISAEKAQRERLEYLAHHDLLTGLYSRTHFRDLLDQAVVEARDSGELMGVILLNLDRFKDVNDSYGHAVGDEVLRHLAEQVRGALRPGDVLGSLAGDEMAVLARHLPDAAAAEAVAQRLLQAVSVPWRSPEGLEVVASASVGICMFPAHAEIADTLLQGAHAAVHGAKALGRGIICFFEESMTQDARERLVLEARLRQAIAQGQLELHYQPQVNIATGQIIGAEALVRWNDPQEGMISPARFIPLAESTGLIGPLGDWVVREACAQGRRWLDQGLPALTLAVNVSPRQFILTDLVASTRSALEDSGYPATLLELEITESALVDRFEDSLLVLKRLREMGVRLAIDDFGTGYSSLAHLKRFPLDVLKIDRGFIRDVPQNTDDMAISSAIIAMGHSLDLRVLAEGVETQAQLDFLRSRGCDTFQGYLCSPPLPAAKFATLLEAQKTKAIAAKVPDLRTFSASTHDALVS